MKAYLQRNLQKFASIILTLLAALDTKIDNKKPTLDINPSVETIASYDEGTIWLKTD